MYTSLEEQTVYRTNFQGVVPSATFITVQERLGKNEKFGRANAPSKMKELAGLVKCADCGYAIKIYHFPNLNCYGRSTLHCCNVSIKITFPILREKVAVEVQKQLDVIACKLLESNMKAKKEAMKSLKSIRKSKGLSILRHLVQWILNRSAKR